MLCSFVSLQDSAGIDQVGLGDEAVDAQGQERQVKEEYPPVASKQKRYHISIRTGHETRS